MSNCQRELMALGEAYPRTCFECALGPCRHAGLLPTQEASETTLVNALKAGSPMAWLWKTPHSTFEAVRAPEMPENFEPTKIEGLYVRWCGPVNGVMWCSESFVKEGAIDALPWKFENLGLYETTGAYAFKRIA